MDYETIFVMEKKDKTITFFLKKGEDFSKENIVDMHMTNKWNSIKESKPEYDKNVILLKNCLPLCLAKLKDISDGFKGDHWVTSHKERSLISPDDKWIYVDIPKI